MGVLKATDGRRTAGDNRNICCFGLIPEHELSTGSDASLQSDGSFYETGKGMVLGVLQSGC